MQDAIEQSIKQTKADKTKSLFRKDEWTDEQLQAALAPKDYRALKRSIDLRKEAFEGRQAIKPGTGSQTQLRGLDAEMFGQGLGDVAAAAATGQSLRGAIMSKLIEPLQRRAQGVTPFTTPAYASRLFESDPEKILGLLTEIEARRQGLLAPIAKPSRGGLLGGAVGVYENQR